jgi:hypothetical protein
MSIFSKALQSVTKDHSGPETEMKYVDFQSNVNQLYVGSLREIKVGARFLINRCISINEDHYNLEDISKSITKQMNSLLIEELFGEFRPILREMKCAVISNNNTRMYDLIQELEKQMYDI